MMTAKIIREYNEDVLYRCEEGDLLEFRRVGYSHWGVYVGDERVIHRALGDGKVEIQEDDFWDVAGNDRVSINNYSVFNPLPGWKVVERARSKLGETGYNMFFKNCEHFANWCRYDVEFSRQALTAGSLSTGLTTAGVATANPALVLAGVGLGSLMTLLNLGSKGSSN